MIRATIKPAKSWFGGRRQWSFEIRAANGERIDPRDTYANRSDVERSMALLFSSPDPVELVVQDRYGNVEYRAPLR